jgi:hypothetical protein
MLEDSRKVICSRLSVSVIQGIDVKWRAMEIATRSILATVTTEAIHTLNGTASVFAMHSSIAASGLPIAAGIGFVPGFLASRGGEMISVLNT